MERIEPQWELDTAREAARLAGRFYIGGDANYVSRFTNNGPWMRRRQWVRKCVDCRVDYSDGPDFWQYCPHHQPHRDKQ